MHEASLVLGLLETVQQQCRLAGYQHILSIRLRIGKASGISPDCLQFAFEVAKRHTSAQGAELLIESVPLGGECRQCGQSVDFTDLFPSPCPACASHEITITRGYEMDVLDMDVE